MPLAAIVHNFMAGWEEGGPGRGPGSTAVAEPGRTRTVTLGRSEALCVSDVQARPAGTTRTIRNRSTTRTF